MLFSGRLTTRAPTQTCSDTKKGQFDVLLLVFVSADNINVSARLNTDLFILKKCRYFSEGGRRFSGVAGRSEFPRKGIFFGKSVSALTPGSIALTNTNENLLGWIYFSVVGCFWVGGMKLADPDFHE